MIHEMPYEDFTRLEERLNTNNQASPTIVPSIYFIDEEQGKKYVEGHLQYDPAPRSDAFGGVGPFETYRLYCMPNKLTFSEEDFKKGLKQMPSLERTIYVILQKDFITDNIKKILEQENNKYTIVEM